MAQTATKTLRFTEEQIEQANRVSMVELAQQYGFKLEKGGRKAFHAQNSGGLYIFKDSNRFYHWTSNSKGGAIDFVMKYDGKTFTEAVAQLIGESYEPYVRERIPYVKAEKGPLVLPDKAANFTGLLVSGKYPGNCTGGYLPADERAENLSGSEIRQLRVCSYDRDKNPKYCSMRAARTESDFKQDKENSDKSYPFYVEGISDTVIVSESPIDLMSHATLAKMHGLDWKQDHRISLGCTWDGALERYLKDHLEIKRIVFALDNDFNTRDKDGKRAPNYGQMAAAKYCDQYGEQGYACAIHRPHLKDFNQDLTEIRKGKSPKELDAMRVSILEAEFESEARDEPEEESEDELEP